jgi:TetR/AcrR family transcriptional regulator
LTVWTKVSICDQPIKVFLQHSRRYFRRGGTAAEARLVSAEKTAAKPRTRIQRQNRNRILEAALEVFSQYGFRGSTIDQIAEQASMSKPNLLYYFRSKEEMHHELIHRLLETWLAPLEEMRDDGDPVREIRGYIRRKLEMARDYPRESRLFANEILQGAPRVLDMLEGELKALVDEKAKVISGWMRDGKLRQADPYHLIFSIWATTQHYADFDVQVRAVLGRGHDGPARFEDAARFLENLFLYGLLPR